MNKSIDDVAYHILSLQFLKNYCWKNNLNHLAWRKLDGKIKNSPKIWTSACIEVGIVKNNEI